MVIIKLADEASPMPTRILGTEHYAPEMQQDAKPAVPYGHVGAPYMPAVAEGTRRRVTLEPFHKQPCWFG
jgi:hypothetical protein